jgi:hypothetical protein
VRVQAGKYFAKCGQYSRTVSLYLQCGDRMLDEAIKVRGPWCTARWID